MSMQLVDIGDPTDPALERVRFGRSRALALLGGLLFSAALRVTAPDLASANHVSSYPCFGYKLCHNCSGTQCIDTCGTPCTDGYLGCPNGTQCWYTCYCRAEYLCCDWVDNCAGYTCICRAYIGPCGGSC